MRHYSWMACLLLAGCATGIQAPVVERAPSPAKKTAPAAPAAARKVPAAPEKDWRPDSYTVKKGDTLYSIGLEFGFDHKEIAQWNNIKPPYVIYIGQQLKLKEPSAAAAAAPAETGAEAVTAPLRTEPAPTARRLDETPRPAEPQPSPNEAPLLTEPKALKEPYSERAMAVEVTPKAAAKPPEKPAETAQAEPEKNAPAAEKPAVPQDDEAIEWSWPVNGKILAGFNDAASAKGIDIAGNQGQPVYAAAPGKVVYSGSGLRGYGKLVIIKHNKTYLSAYAHNSQLLVKEGQIISKGQKIAEMGNTDTDRVKLHFEIRKLGKPVDPGKYLPAAAD